MDRDSLRRLRAQPGYLPFVSAATLARVSDEMFSVGVVLLVLDRTGSAGLAGLAWRGSRCRACSPGRCSAPGST